MNQRKQMLDIIEEVELSSRPLRMVKCLAVHNEQDWVEYSLANNYDEYDVIRVVEGAVKGRPGSTQDGHSIDNTLELIRNFPDPDGKIELYMLGRHFKSLEEQKQTFLDVATEGDILIITDGDEFYHTGDVNRIRRAFELRPNASEIIPTFLHFYRDFGHIRDYGPEWNLWHQRIIRYQNGMRYHTHPVATDINGLCTYFSNEYLLKRYMVPGLYIYHYGHAKSIEFHRMKKQFYSGELSSFKLEDGTDASMKFDEKFDEFESRSEPLEEVLAYNGLHPAPLAAHPLMSYKDEVYDTMKFKDYLSVKAYSTRLPVIPQWMIYESKMPVIYNELNVK